MARVSWDIFGKFSYMRVFQLYSTTCLRLGHPARQACLAVSAFQTMEDRLRHGLQWIGVLISIQ
jgi:hypothetical protein